MTDLKQITRCMKNCYKLYEAQCDCSNGNCYLNKICCCHDVDKSPNRKKEDKNKDGSKICSICCCVKKAGNNTDNSTRQKCVCFNMRESNEKALCKVCFCILKDCICKDNKSKSVSEILRPRKLCEDLPLYDENSHLLGYIKKGSIIDEPFCGKSWDSELQISSNPGPGGWPRSRNRVSEQQQMCMASCRYAEGVRRESRLLATSVPRWTTRSAFDHATVPPRQKSPTMRQVKKKTCACGN